MDGSVLEEAEDGFNLQAPGCPILSSGVWSIWEAHGDVLDPVVGVAHLDAIRSSDPGFVRVQRIECFACYEPTRQAFAVVMTGETAKYGNILLKKGVTPCA